jgi:hypothetical protein
MIAVHARGNLGMSGDHAETEKRVMRYLDKLNGFKTRQACVRKLDLLLGDSGPATIAFVVANSDGTFSAAVALSDKEMYRARSLAERGIYVIGPLH